MQLPNRIVRGALSFALVVGATAASLPNSVGARERLRPPAVLADVPPPTPVPPFGSPSPFPTSLTTPSPSATPPKLGAPSAVLEDLGTGQVLFTKAAGKRRPVASLTKIMTALIALERLDPSKVVTVRADAASQTGARLGLRIGERITVRNLLYGLLLSSANDAAVALSVAVAGSVPAFVRLMNRRAATMGLPNTRFASPTGLDDRGYSTAADLAAIVRTAYAEPMFAAVVRTRFWNIPAPSGPPRHIQNRNALLWLYRAAIGVKTGFTSRAGFCLVAAAVRNQIGVAAVVLGDSDEAFDDAATLLNFGLLEFERVVVIHAGEAVGSVRVGGTPVPAVAAADLVGLVRNDRAAAVVRMIRPTPGLALPISAGEAIGAAIAMVDGMTIGSVAVVAGAPASAAPAPVPGPPGAQVPAPVVLLLRFFVVLLRALAGAFL